MAAVPEGQIDRQQHGESGQGVPARDAAPQEWQENDREGLHRDRQRKRDAADQCPAARERERSEGDEERAGHVEMSVTGNLERNERAPEVREHPAWIRAGSNERPPDDERQECVADEGGHLDGSRRFARRRLITRIFSPRGVITPACRRPSMKPRTRNRGSP